MALDRQRVIDDVLLGEARALSAPFFPSMPGADPSIAPWPFDLAKAGAALGLGGKRLPLRLIAIASHKNPTNEETFAIFRRDLASVGVDLAVDYVTAKEFDARITKRDFDGAFLGWLPDVADPDPSSLLHSGQIARGQNLAGWADPAADALLEAGRATPDRAARKAIYAKLHAMLHEAEPYTVLYAPFAHQAWSRRLGGVAPADIGQPARFPGLAGWWSTTAPAR
jgi:peptide/nickel transport system substrate-binding protein